MSLRQALHTMVELLADHCAFEGRRVTVEIINGTELRFAYDPPLRPEAAPAIALAERDVCRKVLQ